MADTDKYFEIINILGGEKKIDELYQRLGSEKISIVSLRRFIKVQKVKLSYEQKKSIAKIASENGVSKMTVYRLIRKFRKFRKK
jgi:predicted DNA-binding protein YlxM (UPF0122 family)